MKSVALWIPHENTGVLDGTKSGSRGLCSVLCSSLLFDGEVGTGDGVSSGHEIEVNLGFWGAVALLSLTVTPIGEGEQEGCVVGTVRTFGAGVGRAFLQFPSLLGRQLEHFFPAFTQVHFLHMPVLLHLQHCPILFTLG